MPSKSTMCNICGKVMRSDHLQRHVKAKHDNEEVELRQSSTEKCANDQEQFSGSVVKSNDCKDVDAKLEFELQRDRDIYLKNVDIGRQVAIVLRNGDIPEESLSKQNKFCLELFRAQQPTTEVANAELRQWQTQLLDVIEQEQMNDRMIIWVMGRKGNEGKSWFQSYIQSLHGAHRVARFDITNKTSDLLHIIDE